ncbi:dethiobiotin synthase [Methylomonas sp. HW2-6]|uniref:dethiobiotin synthase n=1 Tax=Methylomonas sp. HW2-6 TaxID=3376687 RepID=UPI004042736A
MKIGYFVTGTDTDIGKTWATAALLRRFRREGYSVAGMKPVAAGCERHGGKWQNQDALLLMQNASVDAEYELVNPYAFEQPVSPHLACGGETVEPAQILAAFGALQQRAQVVLVEGAGGWYSPMSLTLDNAGLAGILGLPVLVVVGIRLGCLNHARLTVQAVLDSGLRCAGWIGMQILENMPYFAENVAYLQEALPAPFLGVLPYSEAGDFELLSSGLQLPTWQNIDLHQEN